MNNRVNFTQEDPRAPAIEDTFFCEATMLPVPSDLRKAMSVDGTAITAPTNHVPHRKIAIIVSHAAFDLSKVSGSMAGYGATLPEASLPLSPAGLVEFDGVGLRLCRAELPTG